MSRSGEDLSGRAKLNHLTNTTFICTKKSCVVRYSRCLLHVVGNNCAPHLAAQALEKGSVFGTPYQFASGADLG
jgi:hypothetical protein